MKNTSKKRIPFFFYQLCPTNTRIGEILIENFRIPVFSKKYFMVGFYNICNENNLQGRFLQICNRNIKKSSIKNGRF